MKEKKKNLKNPPQYVNIFIPPKIGNLDAQMKAGGNQDKHRPAATQDNLWFVLVVLSKVVCVNVSVSEV